MSSLIRTFCPVRRPLLLALALALPMAARAQNIGLGTAAPDPAAALDLRATTRGLLIPRLDSVARVAIAAPPDGLLVFQRDGRRGFWYARGGAWRYLPPPTARPADNLGNHTATQNLRLGAFALTGGGASGLSVSSGGAVQMPTLAGIGGRLLTADATGTLAATVPAADLDNLLRLQRGTATIGGATSGLKVVTVNFPTAFAAAPSRVLVTARTETGQTYTDTFAVTTKSITATSFTVNVLRVDQRVIWAQNLLLDWVVLP